MEVNGRIHENEVQEKREPENQNRTEITEGRSFV